MTILLFGSARVPAQLFWILAAGCTLTAALGLLSVLNEDFSWRRFAGRPHERFWAAAALGALALFLWAALYPFLPGAAFGQQYWPIRLSQSDLWLRFALLAPLGAAAFFVASDEGLAGGFWGWKPVLGPGRARPLLFGAWVGAGFALFGVCANRGLFLAEALTRIGFGGAGIFLLAVIPALFVLAAAAIVLLPAYGWTADRWHRLILGAGLAAAWVIPVELGDAYLRLNWDFGPSSLAAAARLPPASEAPAMGILVLADRDGGPGRQYREDILAGRGVALDAASLEKLEGYLRERKNRTLFRADAAAALRRGWQLQWRPGRYLDATMSGSGKRFPPDYEAFLNAIRVAPATEENRERLDIMAERASGAGFTRVKTAQKIYEGFSAAYARYGDLDSSNAWLDRIRGLWPLFEDNIHIEPIEENFDGWIGGRLRRDGRPASDIRVGLFALPSTMTVVGAFTGLTDSQFPDEDGRFEFTQLTTGRYYLALRGEPAVLSAEDLQVRNAPGVITLRFGEMSEALLPIEIGGGGRAP